MTGRFDMSAEPRLFTADRFLSGLRALLNIDRHQVPFLSGEEWHRFRTDPFRFVIRADDDTAAKVWAIVEGRVR